MGFFSWDCKVCGHPMLSPMATNKINRWMTDVVVILSNNTILTGTYDGYGSVGNNEIPALEEDTAEFDEWNKEYLKALEQTQLIQNENEKVKAFITLHLDFLKKKPTIKYKPGPECYHRACWLNKGKPKSYTGESTRSKDQGWFFDEGEHDISKPEEVIK